MSVAQTGREPRNKQCLPAGHRARSLRITWTACLLFCFALACGKQGGITRVSVGNHPPVIQQITVDPDRVHARQRVRVSVMASDADGDLLTYKWKATRGSFPDGYQSSSVIWSTANERGSDVLRVEIGDLHFLSKDSLRVDLVGLAPPESLRATAGAGYARVAWNRSIDEGVLGWQGYHVFRSTRSFAEIPPESLFSYLITPTPIERESLRVVNLQPGQIYYFKAMSRRRFKESADHVWVEESRPSEEVRAAPRPEGILEIREFRNPAGPVALDLSANGQVRSLDPTGGSNVNDYDLYLGTSDPAEQDGPLIIKSVSRLASYNSAWSARQIGIKPIEGGWGAVTTTDQGWDETAALSVGGVYAVKMPEGNSYNFAKIRVIDVAGVYPYRVATLQWAYQLIPDFPFF